METCQNFGNEKKAPANVEATAKADISKMKGNVALLKEQTLISKYCPNLEKLIPLIDFPFESFETDVKKHFLREDEESKKKKVTICTTRKAALLW